MEPQNFDTRLRQTWLDIADHVPEGYLLGGVTYHGPERQPSWVAFLIREDTWEGAGPEGHGESAVEALESLAKTMRDEAAEDDETPKEAKLLGDQA